MPKESVKKHGKSQAGKIVTHISNSKAFKKYIDSSAKENITEYDVCSMLLCTLDAPNETKIKNLNSFRDKARMGGWDNIVEFLTWIEKKFPDFFSSDPKKKKGIYG